MDCPAPRNAGNENNELRNIARTASLIRSAVIGDRTVKWNEGFVNWLKYCTDAVPLKYGGELTGFEGGLPGETEVLTTEERWIELRLDYESWKNAESL